MRPTSRNQLVLAIVSSLRCGKYTHWQQPSCARFCVSRGVFAMLRSREIYRIRCSAFATRARENDHPERINMSQSHIFLRFLRTPDADDVPCTGRAITVDVGDVQTIVLCKREHRALENGIRTAICLPPRKGVIDSHVVDLRTASAIDLDWQFLPLPAQVKQTQNVAEAAQFRRGAATARSDAARQR